jgi:hypothetical protein
MKLKNLLLLAAVSLASAACGKLELNIEGLNPLPAELFLATGSEFVSGAQLPVTTSGGYRVESSIGQPFGTMMSTTSGGYKVYSTVQGQISSEPAN